MKTIRSPGVGGAIPCDRTVAAGGGSSIWACGPGVAGAPKARALSKTQAKAVRRGRIIRMGVNFHSRDAPRRFKLLTSKSHNLTDSVATSEVIAGINVRP